MSTNSRRYPVLLAVAVAQLVEPRVVVPVVAGSNPVRHLSPAPGLTRCKWRVSVRSTGLEVRVFKSVALVLAIGLAVGGSTAFAGATASADVDVSVQKAPGPPAVAGITFPVDVGIGNAGPDSVSAHLFLDLPSGLVATSPNPIGCPVGQGTLDCGRQDLAAGEDSDQFSRLRADHPGSYTVVVRATELTAADPNPANNTASLIIAVQAPKPTVRGFAISPAKPRAGAPLKVSYAITEQVTGQALVPSAVRCSATAGAAKVAGRGSARGTRATCTFRPSSSARGKTMRGRVTATVAGAKIAKAFVVKLR